MSNLKRLKTSEIMNEHVVTGRPNDSISKIAAEMEDHNIGSVVIVQNRKVVGILTERDFVRIAKQGIFRTRESAKHHMTKPVVTVRSDTSVDDLVKIMRKKHVRHIPVLDSNHKLVGIISSRDLANITTKILPSLL